MATSDRSYVREGGVGGGVSVAGGSSVVPEGGAGCTALSVDDVEQAVRSKEARRKEA